MSGIELPMFGNGVECYEYLGEITGGVFGLLTGVLFGVWLKRYLDNGCDSGRAVGMGAVAGISEGVCVYVYYRWCDEEKTDDGQEQN